MSNYLLFKIFLMSLLLGTLRLDKVHAIGTAKVLEVSSTGMSLILDRGSFEGIKLGMKGRLLRPVGSLERPKFKYLAYGEVVKVHSNYSYWYLRDTNKAEFLDKGQKVVFVSMQESTAGRRDARFLKRKVILREGSTPLKYVEEKESGVPSELIKKGDGYDESNQQLTETYPAVDEERIITEFETWSKSKKLDYIDEYMQEVATNRQTEIGPERNLDDYRKKDKEELFKKCCR